ncbi:MAG: hypothetical protein Kow00105_17680 [Phycisphaeraceae bacterium]
MTQTQNRSKPSWPVPPGLKDCDEQTKRTTFEQFVGKTNFMLDVSFQPLFTQLILKELHARPCARVLDIGCGRGIGRFTEYTHVIAAESGELWGIEPDTTIQETAGLFHHFQHALLEDAELPSDYFDVAYAVFVMEHVADPERFLRTVYRTLKPGGSFIFLTPNASAFFGWISRTLNRLKLDEMVLRQIKRAPEEHAYHYPIVSRCNRVREIDRYAQLIGFLKPEYAFFQFSGTGNYFKGPLKIFYNFLIKKRRLLNNPKALDSMVCRLTRPADQ